MARIRTIKPEFWESERVGKLGIIERLTFLGLISLADDEGRGRGDSDYLWGRLHAYYGSLDDPGTLSALQRQGVVSPSVGSLKVWWSCVLRSLKKSGLAKFYKSGGCSYYWIVGFCEHQRVDHPYPSKLPSPPSFANVREHVPGDQGSRIKEGKGRDQGEEAALRQPPSPLILESPTPEPPTPGNDEVIRQLVQAVKAAHCPNKLDTIRVWVCSWRVRYGAKTVMEFWSRPENQGKDIVEANKDLLKAHADSKHAF